MARDIWGDLMEVESRLDDVFRRVASPVATHPYPTARPFRPATDILARNGDVVLRFELPGIDPTKDVTVTAENGAIVVHGERKHSYEFKSGDYYRLETTAGTFERRVLLPEGVEEAKITATYQDGILEVVVPGATKKIAPHKAKEIPIETTATPAKATTATPAKAVKS